MILYLAGASVFPTSGSANPTFTIVALFLGLLGLGAFLWALRANQFEDLDGEAERILRDDDLTAQPAAAQLGIKLVSGVGFGEIAGNGHGLDIELGGNDAGDQIGRAHV